jgi:putative protease
MEKLKVALAYGADAVYFGGGPLSLRARAEDMADDEIDEAIAYVHSRGKHAYLTVNAIPHNTDIAEVERIVRRYAISEPDAFVVADPGVLDIVKEVAPHIPVHLSTQANAVNWRAVRFWHRMGVDRVILAREMTRDEILQTRQETDVELEVFVHGAMCISYSGRCLLSTYLADRDANRGRCAQPCRWRYALVEESCPGEYLPVFEDARGTYILNSRDLCLLEYMPELIDSGIDALKIEGRMKSVHYVAVVTRVYRRAIDACVAGRFTSDLLDELMGELQSVSHRPYTTGFWSGTLEDAGRFAEHSAYIREADFLGVVSKAGLDSAVIDVRDRVESGELVEVVDPHHDSFLTVMPEMTRVTTDDDGVEVRSQISVAHANYTVEVQFSRPVSQYALLRRRVSVS